MSIADEARAEARKLYRDSFESDDDTLGKAFDKGWDAHAEWLASRKPEAEPIPYPEDQAHQMRWTMQRAFDKAMRETGDRNEGMIAAGDALLAAGYRKPEAAPSDTDDDERILAWMEVADHEAFTACYEEERPLIESVMDRLTDLVSMERTITELTPSQPVQVEVTAHKITQRMPWPPSPESSFMLSLFECSCGWKTNTFKDTRDNRATIEGYRQFAEAHVAALGGGDHE